MDERARAGEASWDTLRRIARDCRSRRDLRTAMELEAIADRQEAASPPRSDRTDEHDGADQLGPSVSGDDEHRASGHVGPNDANT